MFLFWRNENNNKMACSDIIWTLIASINNPKNTHNPVRLHKHNNIKVILHYIQQSQIL